MIPHGLQRSVARRRRFLATLFWAGAAAAVGCTHVPPLGLKPPQLKTSDIQIKEIGWAQIRFTLNIDAFNPNDRVLPFSRLALDVDVLGQPFAQGIARDAYIELPAQAGTTIPIEFVVPTSRVRDVLRSLRSTERIPFDYLIRGSAVWGTDGVQLPFERRGEISGLKRLSELLQR